MMLTDNAATACSSYTVVQGRLQRCGGTRAVYQCGGGQAALKCLCCGHTRRVDVTYDVPRKVKTVEQWRRWWESLA